MSDTTLPETIPSARSCDPPPPLKLIRHDHDVISCPDAEVRRPDPKGRYELTSPIYVVDAQQGALRRFLIPKGFKTDLASVPRAFWSFVLNKDDLGLTAPIVHDFLYQSEGCGNSLFHGRPYTRAEADRFFYDLMRADGIGRFISGWAYVGVRIGGIGAWKGKDA